MSEFETYEALMLTQNLAVLASMNFLAILVTYIVAAYVAGKKLPAAVAIGTSIVYTMFLVPPMGGVIGNLSRTNALGIYFQASYPDNPAAMLNPMPLEMVVILFAVPMVVGWLGSLYFMHLYIRGKKETNA